MTEAPVALPIVRAGAAVSFTALSTIGFTLNTLLVIVLFKVICFGWFKWFKYRKNSTHFISFRAGSHLNSPHSMLLLGS